MSATSTALLVLGMHRSGTSATSGALELLGFDLGQRLVSAAEDNPRGYFEHEALVEIHEGFLESLGRRWSDPTPIPAAAWQGDAAEAARAAIREVVAREFLASPRWALKDPRLSRLLPLWAPLWAGWRIDPVSILVIRKPGEVAASLQRRDGFPAALSSCLWLTHVIEALEGSRGRRVSCIDYAELVAAPAAVLERALGSLGVDSLRSDPGRLAGFVDPAMNHHTSRGGASSDVFSTLAADVHARLAEAPELASAIDLGVLRARFDAAWSDEGPAIEAGVAAFRASVRSSAHWRGLAFDAKSALAAQIQWSEQAVLDATALRDEIEALASNADEMDRVTAALRRDLELADRIARDRQSERDALLVERHATRLELDALRGEMAALERRNADLVRQLQDILGSRSWRWTAPFRDAARRLGRRSR